MSANWLHRGGRVRCLTPGRTTASVPGLAPVIESTCRWHAKETCGRPVASDNLTDRELSNGWRRGNPALEKMTFRKFAPQIMGYFRQNVYDCDKVEELVQETFFECLKVNKPGYESLVALDPDPLIIGQQADRLFMKAMRKLPFSQQIALKLSFRVSGREVTEALSLPQSTVRSWIRIRCQNSRRLLVHPPECPRSAQTGLHMLRRVNRVAADAARGSVERARQARPSANFLRPDDRCTTSCTPCKYNAAIKSSPQCLLLTLPAHD